MITANHFTAADKEYLYACSHSRPRQPDRVLVAAACNDILLFPYFVNSSQLITQLGSQFKLQVFSSLLHAPFETFHYIITAAFKKQTDSLDHLAISLNVDFSRTRRETALNMKLQAWPLPSQLTAGAQREELFQQIQCFMDGTGVCIGSEIT